MSDSQFVTYEKDGSVQIDLAGYLRTPKGQEQLKACTTLALHVLEPPYVCKHEMCSGSIGSDGTGHSQCDRCGKMLWDTRRAPSEEGQRG